jgi:ParB-like chromosome segregation protein Spo0J
MLYANEHLGGKFEIITCDIEPKVNGKNPSGAELKFRQLADGSHEKLCAEDEAAAIKSLVEEDGCTVAQIAERMRCSTQHVRDMLKFGEADEGIKQAVRSGQMSATTAVKTAKATEERQKEVKEKLNRGEKVKGIDLAEPTKRLTDDQIRSQIKKADAAFCLEKTEKGQMKYKGMVEAFRITLGEAEPI